MNLELIDVESFLTSLGVRNVKEDGQEVTYSCPFGGHKNGDANPSASMQKNTTKAHCFSCGWSGNAITFLCDLEGVSPLKALQWLREEYGDGFREPDETLSKEINEMLSNVFMNYGVGLTLYRAPILDEEEVEKRKLNWDEMFIEQDYMLSRGFSPRILKEFEIGWDNISQRYSIPIRDEYGNLIGFKGRALPEVTPKYLVLGGNEYGFEPYYTSGVVFGIHKVKQFDELILCEGELNAISMHQKGFQNTIGISGKFLSTDQLNIILKTTRKIILIFDEMRDAINAAKILSQYIPTKIVPEHDLDPADLTVEEISSLLGNSMSSLLV